MKIARIMLAGTAALAIGSTAFAQQSQTGMVTIVDRIHRTVTIQPAQSGTVGANGGGAAVQSFKVADGVSLEDLHAGDRVSAAVTEAGGSRTITKFDKP
jgi:Cu/Ag efflux protein CusF